LAREDADIEQLVGSGRAQSRGKSPVPLVGASGDGTRVDTSSMAASELAELIQGLNSQMHAAAEDLQFEVAARLRDEIGELKKELRQMQAAGAG
ncbi:UvrB/UvrC motif-containing protein, partial [Mumia sp.]